MATSTIEVIRRDTTTINLTFKDADGNIINISGNKLYFTVKQRPQDKDEEALIKKDITSFTDPTQGKAQIILSPTDTDIPEGQYVYDFQLKASDGSIQSTRRGALAVTDDVTTRTS